MPLHLALFREHFTHHTRQAFTSGSTLAGNLTAASSGTPRRNHLTGTAMQRGVLRCGHCDVRAS